jgi:hypothetical protein
MTFFDEIPHPALSRRERGHKKVIAKAAIIKDES